MSVRVAVTVIVLGTTLTPISSALGAPAQTATAWNVRQHPAPAQGKPRSTDPNAVSCSTATKCVTVGHYDSTDPALRHRLFLVITDPTSGATEAVAAPLPADVDLTGPGDLTGVSCDGSQCVAVGAYYNRAGVQHPLIETQLRADRWTVRTMREIHGTLHDVACSAQSCIASGDDGTGPLLLAQSPTGWTRATITPPAGETLTGSLGLACPASGTCVAYATAVTSGQLRPVLLYPSGSGWTGVNFPVPAGVDPNSVHLGGMSCTSTANCVAFGSYDPHPFTRDQKVLTEVLADGVLHVEEVPLPPEVQADPGIAVNTVSCGTAVDPRCLAVARYGLLDPAEGFAGSVLFVVAHGVVATQQTAVFGTALLDASCFQAATHTRCVATGAGPTVVTYRARRWTSKELGRPHGIPLEPYAWDASLDQVSCADGSCSSIGTWETLDQGMFPHDRGALLGTVSGIS